MECLGLHNKPKAEVHPGHKLTGPKEEEEEFFPLFLVNKSCIHAQVTAVAVRDKV
jgi:hypothetical protein